MKTGIIGYGFVGEAIAKSHIYHTVDDVIICDPDKLGEKSATLDEVASCDLIYVCVPSPMMPSGECDSSTLENVVSSLSNVKVPIICKTTAPPNVYEKLQKENNYVLHSPEFLTARNHIKDYLECRFFIFGGDKDVAKRALDMSLTGRSYQYYDIVFTDIKSAALFKYLMNSYLATKVTYMNEFKLLSENLGVDWSEIQRMISYDTRIGNSHTMVPGIDGKRGWAGSCFPKDISAIIKDAETLGVDMQMLKSVVQVNNRHRGLGHEN